MGLETSTSLIDSGLDGLKTDIKGDRDTYREYCGTAIVEDVRRNVRGAKKTEIHEEIVNLVLPSINDSKDQELQLVERLLTEAG